MAKAADVYFQVDPWKIIEEGFDPAYSRVSESVFSLANESLGVRGCLTRVAARIPFEALTSTVFMTWNA